jgi:hypothetical protein
MANTSPDAGDHRQVELAEALNDPVAVKNENANNGTVDDLDHAGPGETFGIGVADDGR